MTPENTKEFVTTVQRNSDGIPIEFQAQCSSGLAPLTYMEAIKAGIRTVHTAVAPLANGTSMPATESILRNCRHLGFTSDLDEDALAATSGHFRKIAEEEGMPIGVPMEYDLSYFEHQVPGGMMTNLTRQLKEVRLEHKLVNILEEIVLIRKEFGYPPMATPYSQIVGAQAVNNVISGDRYKQINDATIKYVLGYYGEAVGPIDQNLVDKIRSLPRTKEFLSWEPEEYLKSVEELRKEISPNLSDDDLLLKILVRGKPVKHSDPRTTSGPSAAKPMTPGSSRVSFPKEFTVEVDGENFNVKISPLWDGTERIVETATPKGQKKLTESPKGSVVCPVAGLVLSLGVKVGDIVKPGDLVAVVEAMKMRTQVHCPHGGIVRKVWAVEGQMVDPEDTLMVVA